MNQEVNFCDQCGEKVRSGAKFCSSCGLEVVVSKEEEQFCKSCGGIIPKLSDFCTKCGINQSEAFSGDQVSNKPRTITKVIWIIVSFVIPFIGIGAGLKYLFTKNRRKYGCLLLCLGILSIAMWGNIIDNYSDTSQPRTAQVIDDTESTSTPLPKVFSDEQASTLLLVANDFPKQWTAKKNGMSLDAKNDYLTDYNVKKINITLQTHETETAAQTAFSAKKMEAQTVIDGRGISGDKLEDVKKYPLFVWNASSQANIAGVEKWTVIGVYGNITVKVYNEGSMGAPKKDLAVDIAKKQIDRIKGN